MRIVLGRRVILSLRNFAQEFGLGPTKATDGGNVPGAFIGCFTVLQNDDILRPANCHGRSQGLRRMFICPVKLPHPAQIPGGEAGGIRVHTAQIFSGGDSRAFFRPGADELADLAIQFHLCQEHFHQ